MQFHKLPAQGEPQPRALHLLRRRSHLAELLEHFLLILWSDADSRVADGDLHKSILWLSADINPPTFGRELDRIRQQVQDDLPDLALIRLDLAKAGIEACVKRD